MLCLGHLKPKLTIKRGPKMTSRSSTSKSYKSALIILLALQDDTPRHHLSDLWIATPRQCNLQFFHDFAWNLPICCRAGFNSSLWPWVRHRILLQHVSRDLGISSSRHATGSMGFSQTCHRGHYHRSAQILEVFSSSVPHRAIDCIQGQLKQRWLSEVGSA